MICQAALTATFNFLGRQIRKMKPQLPPEIAALFPQNVVDYIYRFIPHLKPRKSPALGFTMSPKAETELRMIQWAGMKGKSEMYLRGLGDFVLDR